MMIAHTQKEVIIPKKNVGERVNLEGDCMGKYAAAATTGLSQRTTALEKELQSLKDVIEKQKDEIQMLKKRRTEVEDPNAA
jgi:riboflavin synthase alpha subunit